MLVSIVQPVLLGAKTAAAVVGIGGHSAELSQLSSLSGKCFQQQ
jgi:hypothetical protein